MKNKVLLDSNVLIAASIYYAGNEIYRIPIKHRFFDNAMQLIGLIKKEISKRVGITTSTIENEVNLVIRDVIINTIEEYSQSVGRTDAFKVFSNIYDSCESRLHNLFLYILREPIDAVQKSIWFVQVTDMFDRLKELAAQVDPQEIAYQKAGRQSGKFKSTAYRIYLKEESKRYAQLKRLLKPRKEPDQIDKEILAEAAYLRNFYAQTEGEVNMFLASTDLIFSPMHGINSRIITDEIERCFFVICDWPDKIARRIP